MEGFDKYGIDLKTKAFLKSQEDIKNKYKMKDEKLKAELIMWIEDLKESNLNQESRISVKLQTEGERLLNKLKQV